MTNSSGGVAYNIVINPKSAVVAKGMNNATVYNNTFYSSLLTTQSGRGLVDIYTNTDYGLNAPSTGTKVFNNIFYTRHKVFNIKIYETSCLQNLKVIIMFSGVRMENQYLEIAECKNIYPMAGVRL